MASETVYGPRSLKSKTKRRRTQKELDAILERTREIIAEERLTTERHVFYRLSNDNLIEKTESENHNLTRHFTKWRRKGILPYSAFADTTRHYYGDRTYDSLTDMLEQERALYRRDLWASTDKHIEVWCEKDAMASILADAVRYWGVQVFTVRGYASLTSIYTAAESFKRYKRAGKEVHVYYFGDYDDHGLDIERNIIQSLREDHGVEVDFQRVAVLPEQIEEFNLPTRPPKKTNLKTKVKGRAVDLDAMPLDVVRELAEQCVIRHIDPYEWKTLKTIENREKETLDVVIGFLRERDGADGV